jgi:hypothetical protein
MFIPTAAATKLSIFVVLIGSPWASESCREPDGYIVALFKVLPLAPRAADYEALLPWRLIT